MSENTTKENDIIVLSRDVEAYLIPSGAAIQLPRYTEVTVTQALGGSYTVNVYGNLARVDSKDADALGKDNVDPLANLDLASCTLEDKIWAYLRTCYDPEIPVNIVELGLVYDCQVLPLGHGDHQVKITMTLTAPGCGMGPVLAEDIKRKIAALDEVSLVEVDIVFDPPWDRSMMSEAAKLQLNVF